MTRLPVMIGVIFLGAAAATAAVVPVRPAPAKPAPTATAAATVPAATGTIPKVSPYSLEGMTERAADLQAKITATPRAQRKVLQEELELLHHQMGPRDSSGARVHCQAMWHEAQIETLGGDIKRFTLLHEGRATPADDLRLYTRRVAVKCLDEGWALSSGRAKFQVDAFGSYLANNMTMLDGLFARVSAWMTAPAKADETAEDAAAHLAAINKIADSITGMAHVADGLV